jgi:hypothetical protein
MKLVDLQYSPRNASLDVGNRISPQEKKMKLELSPFTMNALPVHRRTVDISLASTVGFASWLSRTLASHQQLPVANCHDRPVTHGFCRTATQNSSTRPTKLTTAVCRQGDALKVCSLHHDSALITINSVHSLHTYDATKSVARLTGGIRTTSKVSWHR